MTDNLPCGSTRLHNPHKYQYERSGAHTWEGQCPGYPTSQVIVASSEGESSDTLRELFLNSARNYSPIMYESPVITQSRSDMAREFQSGLGRKVPDAPTGHLMAGALRVSHARMVLEEALELIEALGCRVTFHDQSVHYTDWDGVATRDSLDVEPTPGRDADITAVAHEGVDLQYITETTLVMFGLPVEDLWREIHTSNMSKILPNGILLRHQGTDPHEQYIKPDVRGIIDRARHGATGPASSDGQS